VVFQLRRAISVDLAAGSGGRMLDLATGTGEISVAVAKAAGVNTAHLNGLSKGMLAVCRKQFEIWERAPKTLFTKQDAFVLMEDSEPEAYDLVLALGLIAHTGKLDRLLTLIERALVPGGAVLLQSSLDDRLGARLMGLYARSLFCSARYKVASYSSNDSEVAARKAGLENQVVRRFCVCLPFGDKLPLAINYLLERTFAAKCGKGGDALFLLRKPA